MLWHEDFDNEVNDYISNSKNFIRVSIKELEDFDFDLNQGKINLQK